MILSTNVALRFRTYLLTVALLFSTVGCVPQANALETYAITVLACLDGGKNGLPDGLCETHGDIPLEGTVFSLRNIFGEVLTEAKTKKGRAELKTKIQTGNTINLVYPASTISPLNGKFVFPAPNKLGTVIHIPYSPKKIPDGRIY